MYAIVLFVQCVQTLRKSPRGEGGSRHVE
jgi:hypothetical protein